MNSLERVHACFRGAAEIAKTTTKTGFVLEVTAAGFAIWGLFSDVPRMWLPITGLGLAFAASCVRALGSHWRAFSRACVRTSARAFALGEDIDPATLSSIESDAPPLAAPLAKWLPAQTLQGYYQPRFPAGEARLREIYAESAFFTWRLLRVFFWALLLLTLIIAAGAFVALYGLVVQSPTDENVKRAILETLCSVTVAIFGMKAAEQTIEVFGQASSVRSVADALIRAPLPCGKVLGELVDDYDIQMSAGKDPPTLLWVLMRSSLNEQWSRRREALGPVPPTATSSAEQ